MPIHRYPGGVVNADNVNPGANQASGVWTLESQLQANGTGFWPQSTSQMSRSLRFNSADSAYLTRTPASASNRKTWTWSGWVKRGKLGINSSFFGVYFGNNDNSQFYLSFTTGDQLTASLYNTSIGSTAVYRDPAAWLHVVVSVNTTESTQSNRWKLYVNGSQITNFSLEQYPTLNQDLAVNAAQTHYLGYINVAGYIFDGLLADVYLIDGQALNATSFGYTDSNNVWQPKPYAGSVGTNGFYLTFADNTGVTPTALGKDYSNRGNNWTPVNFSVASGAGNDSLVDVPTNWGTDTGLGGEVRGNYATLNPLLISSTYATITNGNLSSGSITGTASYQEIPTTFAVNFSGTSKWYAEVNITTVAGTYYPSVGISPATKNFLAINIQCGDAGGGTAYMANGQKYNGASLTSYGSSYTGGDVIGIAVDESAGTVVMYKNNVSQGTLASSLTGLQYITVTTTNSSAFSINFGQRPFAYTAPSGFKALCTQNLSTPTVQNGGQYFNAVLYTGNGSYPRSITGVGFASDFVWIKARSIAYSNILYDVLRGTGTTKSLSSDTTSAEPAFSTNANLSSFDSDGFSIGSTSSTNILNASTQTFVAWNWKANGAGSSNTAGTITSTVSANTTAGFSIVTYTGNATSGATVGHGLGVAPSMMILKIRGSIGDWSVYHTSSGNQRILFLNLSLAQSGITSGPWNSTSPTSTVFTLGNAVETNPSNTMVAYCFAPVAGYSAFGSYTGNGSSDGPFIYTGFRPRYVLIKHSNDANSWFIWDSVRNTYNAANATLKSNSADAEETSYSIDVLSNGFKIRTSDVRQNTNAGTYIYAAFAENPFKIARAR